MTTVNQDIACPVGGGVEESGGVGRVGGRGAQGEGTMC